MHPQRPVQSVEDLRVFQVVDLVGLHEVDEAFGQRDFAPEDVLKVADDVFATDRKLRHHPADLNLY